MCFSVSLMFWTLWLLYNRSCLNITIEIYDKEYVLILFCKGFSRSRLLRFWRVICERFHTCDLFIFQFQFQFYLNKKKTLRTGRCTSTQIEHGIYSNNASTLNRLMLWHSKARPLHTARRRVFFHRVLHDGRLIGLLTGIHHTSSI